MEKHLGLRVDAELLKKFRYVCGYEGRSANKQILRLMKSFVDRYERDNGKIEFDEE